ncbi:hypothetical protein QTO02_26715, partial [Vibrio fortis]
MSTNTMSKTTETPAKKSLLSKEWLIEQKSLIALIFLIVVVSFLNPNFFTVDNILNILRQTSVNAIIAVGMTLVILTAGIDLGVTMVYTDGRPISTGFTDTADAFAWFGTGYAMGIPVPVWIMTVVFAAVWYLLNHTRFGRYVYALGGNESATRLSGIDVDKVKIGVYAICGLLAAVAGIIVASRLSSAQPTAGMGYELDAIAAVVLGGTSLAGGRGRIMGTLIGALIIGFLNNALNLLDVSSYYQMIA